MIVQKQLKINGRMYVYTMSDQNRYIVRDGVSYLDAYDPVEFGRTYTEGEAIPEVDPDAVTAEEIAAAIEEALA